MTPRISLVYRKEVEHLLVALAAGLIECQNIPIPVAHLHQKMASGLETGYVLIAKIETLHTGKFVTGVPKQSPKKNSIQKIGCVKSVKMSILPVGNSATSVRGKELRWKLKSDLFLYVFIL